MKILYSVGNRLGAGTQLQRILDNISDKHEVKVAAYINSSTITSHIDWTLDSLHYNILGTKKKSQLIKLFGGQNFPSLNLKNAEIFVKEIGEFDPDLIISDFEPISAYIAKLYNKQLWYCSSLHLLDGIKWKHDTFDYLFKITYARIDVKRLPIANRYYIYSCFGDMLVSPKLNKNYEWIMPYYKNIDDTFKIDNVERFDKIKYFYNYLDERKTDFFITDGSTSNISDAFYSGGRVITCPALDNYENLVNAIMIKNNNIGSDLGQVELMDKYAIEQFEKAFDKEYNENYLCVKNYSQLHEKVEEYACSI